MKLPITNGMVEIEERDIAKSVDIDDLLFHIDNSVDPEVREKMKKVVNYVAENREYEVCCKIEDRHYNGYLHIEWKPDNPMDKL